MTYRKSLKNPFTYSRNSTSTGFYDSPLRVIIEGLSFVKLTIFGTVISIEHDLV